ncbi:MAG: DUF1294 domain-containing protein [Phycisphaerae bacterium]
MRRSSLQTVWLTNAAALTLADLLFIHFVIGAAWLPSWFVAINVTTFAFYGWDKRLARSAGNLRIPERVLHILALAGGSPAALAAQRFLRHKTAKRSFQTMFWIIFIAQAALLVAWYWPR